MAAAPVVALTHSSPPPASAAQLVAENRVSVVAGGEAAPVRPVDDRVSRSDTPAPDPTTTAPPTTVTVARRAVTRPTYATPRTTATAPVRRAVTTTTRPAPKPASTAPKPAAPKSSSPPPSGNTQTGGATWYDAAPSGTCAHKTLPKGTVVRITSLSTGATASCTVNDRGPYVDGLIIDLAKDVFSRLAPLSQGVVQVRISW